MKSEWMKVMLEEIERKRCEAERGRKEAELREAERSATGAGAARRPGVRARTERR